MTFRKPRTQDPERPRIPGVLGRSDRIPESVDFETWFRVGGLRGPGPTLGLDRTDCVAFDRGIDRVELPRCLVLEVFDRERSDRFDDSHSDRDFGDPAWA